MKKVLTTIQEIFKFKQASKQAKGASANLTCPQKNCEVAL